ncbi:MAG: PAS domain-containing hybrid sensor histidine kinase/response regulator [Pseudomonadota bacterium]
MLPGWIIIGTSLAYLATLFLIASWGDRVSARAGEPGRRAWLAHPKVRALLYPLTLAVYCTSWTLYGSVGLASRDGWSFLTIYIGPILLFTFGLPLLARVIRLAKAHNISSVADFISARHGKSQRVAAMVAFIALLGTVPYIALQLKAVSDSLAVLASHGAVSPEAGRVYDASLQAPFGLDTSLVVALIMALFAILFGTRNVDATEHQNGLMLAVATESVVKLAALLIVGAFITWGLFEGPFDLWRQASEQGLEAPFRQLPPLDLFLAMTGLALLCAILLPRQFHVAVVEAQGADDLRTARVLFPLYLVLINVFVVPIALAGLLVFKGAGVGGLPDGGGVANGDLFVLALPLAAESPGMTILAFLGGLSAATAMVIVGSVALAIMLTNDVVTPLALQIGARARAEPARGEGGRGDGVRGERLSAWRDTARFGTARTVLLVRRLAILTVVMMAYAYERFAGGGAALAAIGLISFAAVSQLAPAFVGGLLWRGGTSRGALAGMIAGTLIWAYTLLLPTFADGGIIDDAFVRLGPWGLEWARPQALFGLAIDPLAHSVFWSLLLNTLIYVGVSRAVRPSAIERVQAALFVPRRPVPAPRIAATDVGVSIGELEDLVTGYLGEARTAEVFRALVAEHAGRADRASPALLNEAERLLASAVGAASSRALLSFLLMKGDVPRDAALQLLDEASAGLQESRGILQTALDQVRQGIAVFDADLRLRAWNKQFVDLLQVPDMLAQPGTPLMAVLRHNAEHGQYGSGPAQARVRERMEQIVVRQSTFSERRTDTGAVLEVRTALLPQGGLVATYTDVTDKVRTAEQLAEANAGLERRVRMRTTEFEAANRALEAANRALAEAKGHADAAKATAETANAGKTRFLAAASHDLMQPLAAARLYAGTLRERLEAEGVADGLGFEGPAEPADLAGRIDASLGAVEDILVTLVDISRLDAGALRPLFEPVRLDDLLEQIRTEFAPTAASAGLSLRVRSTDLAVMTDRRLLLRLLRNVVSNALKYTASGGVLVGVRRRRGEAVLEVSDTGTGIPDDKRDLVFQEFQRLEDGARMSEGLGLGLSIVQRIAGVLNHGLTLRSEVGRGTKIGITLPVIAAPAARPVAAPAALSGLDGLRVLCVDNEPDILRGMRTLLEGWGCTVATAESRGEALAELGAETQPPNVLLLDYHLPRDDGLAIADALREALGTPVPAVLITAERGREVMAGAEARGLHVLHKPLKPARLRALLARLAGEASQTAGVADAAE